MSKQIWINYYDNTKPDARPLGRVRVYEHPHGFLYMSSVRSYKECMKRIKENNENGKIAFIGSPDLMQLPVFARWFDEFGAPCYEGVGMVERVF